MFVKIALTIFKLLSLWFLKDARNVNEFKLFRTIGELFLCVWVYDVL